jgi:SAM-dependent methyltransferase
MLKSDTVSAADLIFKALLRRLGSGARSALPASLLVRFKHAEEMAFWQGLYRKNHGSLPNSHFAYFYTTHFAIPPDEYSGAAILDIGCGPCGSLEWADNAKERVGLDPLVKQYKRLGIGTHRMRYVRAPSEKIPFDRGHFDFVTSFNSLDHVDDVDSTFDEIIRVLKQGGTFLLITEINHPPTPTEPHRLTEDLIERLARDFVPADVRLNAIRSDHDIYKSLLEKEPYVRRADANPGLLSGRFIKK